MINSALAYNNTIGWLDATSEGRFKLSSIDMAINNAISTILKNRSVSADASGKGEARVSSLSLRSELMPMLRTSGTEWGLDQLEEWDSSTIHLQAGYGYKFLSEVSTADDYTKLVAAGFISKLDANGVIVKSVGGINQVVNTEVVIRADKPCELSKVYSIKRSVNPMCVFNSVTGMISRSTLPTSFAYLVAIRLRVSNEWIYTVPTTYDELPILNVNPSTRPSLIGSMKAAYNIESGDGFKIESGKDGIIQAVEVLYLPTPTKVFAGKEYDISMAGSLAALDGKKVIVRSEFAIVSGAVYECGTEFTVYPDTVLTEGIVAYGYRNSDAPNLLHDEICRDAAAMLAISTNNKEKIETLTGSK